MGLFKWLFGSKPTARNAPPSYDQIMMEAGKAVVEQLEQQVELERRKPSARTDVHNTPTHTPPSSPPKPQAKSNWTPKNPRLSCHMPLHLLQHVFVFASDDAGRLSGAVPVVLQDAAENTLEEIMKQAKIDMISKSTEPAEIMKTGQVSELAFHAMEVIAPSLITRHRKGEIRICVRPFPDPPSGQIFAIFLLYNKY